MVLDSILLVTSIAMDFIIGRFITPVLATSTVLIWVSFYYKYRALITFHDTHLEMKVAIARPHIIDYSSFLRLNVINYKKAYLYYTKAGKESRVLLPMTFLSETGREDLRHIIQAKINKESASIFA